MYFGPQMANSRTKVLIHSAAGWPSGWALPHILVHLKMCETLYFFELLETVLPIFGIFYTFTNFVDDMSLCSLSVVEHILIS